MTASFARSGERRKTLLTSVCLADVSANIKGVVSKAMTQKILAAAAERGEITQKTYGTSNQIAWL
jgi:TBPIP/Hop2 winged helix domain